jgi:hypothetical protein
MSKAKPKRDYLTQVASSRDSLACNICNEFLQSIFNDIFLNKLFRKQGYYVPVA